MTDSSPEILWKTFAEQQHVSEHQLEQFQHFYAMVVQANEFFNLTAIHSLSAFIHDHFNDSLIVNRYVDFSKVSGLVDVGTGAGFPGIVLKIFYPQLPMILIEVTRKKIDFLNNVIKELELTMIETYPLDWRTFLRTTTFTADLFCSRASLHPDELIRMFQPSSPYKQAQLVYWASRLWRPEHKELSYLQREVRYKVDHKERALVFFALSKA